MEQRLWCITFEWATDEIEIPTAYRSNLPTEAVLFALKAEHKWEIIDEVGEWDTLCFVKTDEFLWKGRYLYSIGENDSYKIAYVVNKASDMFTAKKRIIMLDKSIVLNAKLFCLLRHYHSEEDYQPVVKKKRRIVKKRD